MNEEWDADLSSADPLAFPGYAEQLARAGGESVRTFQTEHSVVIEGCFEVLGGSMGAVHGERVVRAYRRATELRLPVVVLASSGGARMQEGMVSLVQMARTAAAAQAHAAAGLMQVAVLRSPTTGGVFASYASLTDVRAAHAGATIGFAGPRVVEQTLGITLPATSHTAESAYAAGLIDAVISPEEEASWIEAALGVQQMRAIPTRARPDTPLSGLLDLAGGAWGEVQRARAADRPTGIDHALGMCASWIDLRGADPTVRAGLATLASRRVVVVAHDRHAGDGRTRVGGFRLARRALALAGRIGLPLVTFVDTPGADPSPESEAAGIAGEIAATFAAMAALPTASVSVCVGEGGSGGALAMAAADRFLIQEHAVFSVIAPEGAAAILERDASKAPEVAERLKLTSADLLDLGIVDEVVPETDGALAVAIARALDTAEPGDRHTRFDNATARWSRDA